MNGWLLVTFCLTARLSPTHLLTNRHRHTLADREKTPVFSKEYIFNRCLLQYILCINLGIIFSQQRMLQSFY